MKYCKWCKVEHQLTSEHWYKLHSKPTCKRRADEVHRIYKQKHATEVAKYQKNYRENNRTNRNLYDKKRKKLDVSYKLACNLRSRLTKIISGRAKPGSFTKSLGCSINELRIYLESKFQPGMSWDNYGDWHLDHIRPLASFDLTIHEQFITACHYTNLQPLWAEENIRKADKWSANSSGAVNYTERDIERSG